jgi:hypothetical protein
LNLLAVCFSVDDLDKSLSEGEDSNSHYLSVERIEKLNYAKESQPLRSSGLLSDDKLRTIMSFLDEVDTADRLSEIDQVKVDCTLMKDFVTLLRIFQIKKMI